jgi:hypothetical protein
MVVEVLHLLLNCSLDPLFSSLDPLVTLFILIGIYVVMDLQLDPAKLNDIVLHQQVVVSLISHSVVSNHVIHSLSHVYRWM